MNHRGSDLREANAPPSEGPLPQSEARDFFVMMRSPVGDTVAVWALVHGCFLDRPPLGAARAACFFWTSEVDMRKFDRITTNPEILGGQPIIRGMRLTVRRVVEAVATYPDRQDLLREYPELEAEDIRQALEFAASNLDDRIVPLESA